MKVIKISSHKPEPKILQQAAEAISSGQLVAFPTDTVYGLGCNLFDELAVRRVYKAKQRLITKGLIAFIADLSQLDSLVSEIPEVAKELINAFWPGGLTLIFKAKEGIPRTVTKRNTLGVRLPDHKIPTQLVKEVGFPIATTSANRSGFSTPHTAQEVVASLGEKVDLLLDGGGTGGQESTILNVAVKPYKVIRHGAVEIDKIRKVLKVG